MAFREQLSRFRAELYFSVGIRRYLGTIIGSIADVSRRRLEIIIFVKRGMIRLGGAKNSGLGS